MVKAPGVDDVDRFLQKRFGPIGEVCLLQSGGWSSAFAFEHDGRELVVRFGPHSQDFEKERVAATWQTPGVPVPEIFELGEAFDGYYIVSQRHHGSKLADFDGPRTRRVVENLFGVLAAMRNIELPGQGFGIWTAPSCDAPAASWADYLCSVADRDESRLVDWRRKLFAHTNANAAFARGCAAIAKVGPGLPNVRRLIHADLLLNHLVESNDEISTVFDWGNAIAGDPLYDIAWILFCIPWFPAIERDHVLGLVKQYFPSDSLEHVLNIYELHIGLAALQYQAFVDDIASIAVTTERLESILDAIDR
jgi:hygromycin-B 4-O-kinase